MRSSNSWAWLLHLLELDGVDAFGGGIGTDGHGDGNGGRDTDEDVVESRRLFVAAVFAPEVIGIVAGEDADFTIGNFEDSRSQVFDEVAIVRNEDDGTGEFFESFEEDVFGADIKVVGGFVEK